MIKLRAKQKLERGLASPPEDRPSSLQLDDGSRIAVVGGGFCGPSVLQQRHSRRDRAALSVGGGVWGCRSHHELSRSARGRGLWPGFLCRGLALGDLGLEGLTKEQIVEYIRVGAS